MAIPIGISLPNKCILPEIGIINKATCQCQLHTRKKSYSKRQFIQLHTLACNVLKRISGQYKFFHTVTFLKNVMYQKLIMFNNTIIQSADNSKYEHKSTNEKAKFFTKVKIKSMSKLSITFFCYKCNSYVDKKYNFRSNLLYQTRIIRRSFILQKLNKNKTKI